ncbi:hypothetical protein KP509_1Z068800 [Ceratopteris richardii]|nr:hypothetical protein KP509_1Z068800 [Ceratopteris richardii]
MTSILNSISDLRPVMKKNQVEGFKFLWKNIGPLGSRSDSEGGGCIIAHAPGTGKSLLIISFLKSYLHMDPSCRPLIVAPKNMLLPWHKEFEKWKVNVKVLMLRSSMHSSLDYLKTISEWQRSTSVLIVTYQLFAKLVEDGKACRRLHIQQIGSLLLYIPDILIMDEGHVPRNCSMLRDSLLQIRTRFKILVSGTLFQNNTQELFNLLYLARPSFLDHLQADTCIQRLDILHLEGNRKQWQTFEEFDSERWNNKTKEQVESIACKIFMEEIGNRLEDEADRSGSDNGFKNAIEKLRALTAPFIHIYNGDLLKTLPGVREFIVYLQATSLQVSLSTQIKNQTFLETSLSVHPSLLLKWKGAGLPSCVNAKELEALRRDASQAPKLSFILALADCCSVLKEKLLIFSQFVQTLDLVEELMKSKFKVVSIKGRDGLEERQRVMDEFNESTNTSILLASITACGEGINLTGASRVVFLDMHWNPARMRQASARAFRIGQKRVVYTYWLIASIEKEAEKLKRVQRKDWLSRSIFALDNEECHQQEDLQHNQEEDHVLEYLLKNDVNKSILKAVSYGASDRKMHPVFCEGSDFFGP